MNKSIIVCGPAGCGKTHWAMRIATHFGLLKNIVDDYDGHVFDPEGTLYLTNVYLPGRTQATARVMSFAEVAQQINEAIPKTDWFGPDVEPFANGVYQTCTDERMLGLLHHGFQYWRGENWGMFEVSAQSADNCREVHSQFQNNHWRGLAEEPIGVA